MSIIGGILGGGGNGGSGGGYNSASNSGSNVNSSASANYPNNSPTQNDRSQEAVARSDAPESRDTGSSNARSSAPVEPVEAPSKSTGSAGVDADGATALLDAQAESIAEQDESRATRVQVAQSMQSISQQVLQQSGVAEQQTQNDVELYQNAS